MYQNKVRTLIAILLCGGLLAGCANKEDYAMRDADMPHYVYLSTDETGISAGDIVDEGETEASLNLTLRYGFVEEKTATVEATVEVDFSLVEVYNREKAKEYLPFPEELLSGKSAKVTIPAGSAEASVPLKLIDLDKMTDAQYLLPVTIKSMTASNGFPLHETKKTVYYTVSQEGSGAFKLSKKAPCTIPALSYDPGGEGIGFQGEVVPQLDWIAYTAPGKWLMYTVKVVTEGNYAFDIEAATGWNGAFSFEIDGAPTETFSMKVEGNWDLFWYYEKYPDDPQPVLNLKKGMHKIKFKEESDGFNLRAFRFTYRE